MFLEQLSGIDHSGDGCDVDIGLVALASTGRSGAPGTTAL